MCEIKVKVSCCHCQSANVVKNGKKRTGQQNFKCKECGKQFQYEYFYQGADPRIKRQIIGSLMHGAGIRDCRDMYSVGFKTILDCLLEKAKKHLLIQPKQKHYQCIQIDEVYSFVHNKGKKVWIFYAYAPETGEILAVTMGKRTIQQMRYLMIKLKTLKITVDFYHTDGFEGFKAVLPYFQHIIGKPFTKAIEGVNTAIRAKLARLHRRSTKFSKKLNHQWHMFHIFIFFFNRGTSYI
jgi:insertion element IS1 protein InsB